MSRGKKPLFGKILIEDIGAEGKAIARINNMVVFVPMAVPGDIADIQITRKRKKYLEGKAVHTVEYSKKRVKPVCEHFSICGGCKWQHLSYPDQLFYKEKQVVDTIERIGRINDFQAKPIIGSEKTEFYRNKLEYTFSNNKWFSKDEINSGEIFTNSNAAGFHLSGRYDKILNINKCWLQEEPGNHIRNFIKDYGERKNLRFYDTRNHKGFLRNLIIRNSTINELMVILVLGEDNQNEIEALLNAIKTGFPEITSLQYAINRKQNDMLFDQDIICFSGKDHIIEVMDDLKFRIGPKSFFQTNTYQALRLYRKVKEYSELNGKEIVYDLYTGTGTIANYIARHAKSVIGLESVPEAISDANHNSELNKIDNTKFFAGDIKDLLNEKFILENGRPDIIITDPPRAGMHADVISAILEASPDKIVYVSCNPATQARDIALLNSSYRVVTVQPVDMFPHTHHVESIVVMERRKD